VTYIDLDNNGIGDKGAATLADALKVNTSLTTIFLDVNAVDETLCDKVRALIHRNGRFRRLLLFDARQMLLSRLRGSGDECGVVWLYFIGSNAGNDNGAVPDDIESIRIELAAVVNERRRREMRRPALVSDVCSLAAQMTNKFADQTNKMTNKFADQTNQIADLQRTTQTLVEQNQEMQEQMRQRDEQMQEQMRQIHSLLMSRKGVQTADVDERDKRAVKRRRTGR
jgi:flagellar capping protein FliD